MIPLSSRHALRRIHGIRDSLRDQPDDALRHAAQALRGGEPAEIRERMYALAAEAVYRALGLNPFDEQILGALAMSDGYTAQMQTGQGKTLTAVFPAMLYAASGPAWIATANPYLAARDCEWMRPAYELLGFSVGVTAAGMTMAEKKSAYTCDVLYGTHSEFGFDYLRDQLAVDTAGQVQGKPYFMLVDEVDSILLDEAVTPMILSAAGDDLDRNLLAVDRFVGWLKHEAVRQLDDEEDYLRLDETVDYVVLIRDKVAILTALGQKHAEQYFRIPDLSENLPLYHLIYQALQAHGTLVRDVDYIVRDGKLQIVDPHTGRVMEGRRYCNGLWQALEVKERLDVIKESRTVASISYQQYFRRFPHLCGMTGTAWEGRREMMKVYRMPVRRIPPHQKDRRRDLPDAYSENRADQIAQMAEEARAARERGQPCLIVTRTVSDSEELAEALRRGGMKCEVLNARDDAREAEIIAKAGSAGRITVATALAGRGTDIALDEAARAAGGLYVMGFGHQNTRRGDRQLAGRSGRQGDPGMCRFFVSPEDELLTRFSSDRPKGRGQCLRMVRRAQKSCEVIAESQRETTLKLDEATGVFRESVYTARAKVLAGELPEEYSVYPPVVARAVLLSAIDEAWAAFLAEADVARERIGALSLIGKNYEIEYIREIADMYDAMREQVNRAAHARLAGMKDGVLHVETI